MNPQLEWENEVFEAISKEGDMTRSDAQAIVDAKLLGDPDFLQRGWRERLSPITVALQVLA